MKHLFSGTLLSLLLILCLAQPAAADPRLPELARKQIGVTVTYDPDYSVLPYPGGDVPIERGVCTDVVIRALRELGLDLQKAVHEDMRAHFSAYPKLWGGSRSSGGSGSSHRSGYHGSSHHGSGHGSRSGGSSHGGGAIHGFNGNIKGLTGDGNAELFHIIYIVCVVFSELFWDGVEGR